MKHIKHTLFGFQLGILCLACPVRAQDAATSGPSGGPSVGSPALPNYCLLPNDLVFVKVFQEDDLNSTLRISEDGAIIFPLVGSVKIGGLTVQEATRTLRRLLDARFIVNPQVTLTVLKFSKRDLTILGQVQKPGSYSMKDVGSIDLMEAVGLAGGFTRLANPSRITVKRVVAGRETVTTLDGKKMAHDTSTPPFAVLPGDVISIAERIF